MLNKHESTLRLVLAIQCLVVTVAVFLYFYITGDWLYIAVPDLSPPFADFLFILAGSDCSKLGIDVVIENPCDPWGRAHNYGLLWLNIGKLGVSMEDITWMALSINFTFLILAIFMVSPTTPLQAICLTLFLISPAVMLGLERANADLILFSFLVLGLYFFNSDNLILQILSCSLILITGLLKLYPIVIVPVLLLYYSASTIRTRLLLITLLAFFIHLLVNWSEVSHLLSVIPNITWRYSMGGELLFSRLGYDLNETTRFITWCVAGVVTGLGVFLGFRFVSQKISNHFGLSSLYYLVGTTLIFSSFILKNSFDYRNVYFLFLLPLLFELLTDKNSTRQLKLISASIVLIYGFLFWAEFLISVFDSVNSSDYYIRLIESILNWLIFIPIIMLAIHVSSNIAIMSPWMNSIFTPLKKLMLSK